MIEPKFVKGDYVINRAAGDMAIIKGITKKNYYQFSSYYDAMLHQMKELDKYPYELQVNYQKFWDFCNDEEKKELDEKIKKG